MTLKDLIEQKSNDIAEMNTLPDVQTYLRLKAELDKLVDAQKMIDLAEQEEQEKAARKRRTKKVAEEANGVTVVSATSDGNVLHPEVGEATE